MSFSMNFVEELARLEARKLAENKAIQNPLDELSATLKSYGLEPTHLEVKGYGVFQRIPSNVGGKYSKDSGWYWLEQDGEAMYACFGDWRTGENKPWQSSNIQRLSPDERQALDKRIAEAKELHKAQLKIKRDKAAEKAIALINASPAAKNKHPYLKAKKVKAHPNVKLDGKDLIIPVTIRGQIRSSQRINPKGEKQFAWESETKGGYFWIAATTTPSKIYFCEGYSTGATIAEATGANVMVCFNAQNLYQAIADFRAHDKETPAIVAADNDHKNNNKPCGNTGLIWGQKCVDDFDGIKMIYPDSIEGSDFNDMANEVGIEQVQKTLTNYTMRFGLEWGQKIKLAETDWLIDDYLPKAGIGMVYGASGHMKTFMVFDMALHLATGLPWHGNEVKQAQTVLYVCGEGYRAATRRLHAWQAYKQYDGFIPMMLTDKAAHMLDPDQVFDLVSDITYMMAKNGLKEYPALIILDTLNMCFGDGDENSTRDMTAFISAVYDLHHRTGSMILIVHHSGKGEVKSARGSSALKASLDVEFEVTMINEDEYRANIQPAHIELKCTKIKDDDLPAQLVFEHKSIAIPDVFDRKGKPLTSVILEPLTVTSKEDELQSFINRPLASAGDSKTDFALLALKESFLIVAMGHCRTSQSKAGMLFSVGRNDLNEQFRLQCKKHDIDVSLMRMQKKRSLSTLSDMGFIDATTGDDEFYTTKNKLVINEINNRI